MAYARGVCIQPIATKRCAGGRAVAEGVGEGRDGLLMWPSGAQLIHSTRLAIWKRWRCARPIPPLSKTRLAGLQ